MSPRWRRDIQLFAVLCVSVISSQIVTGDVNYNDVRRDELSAVRPDRARTSRQMLEKFIEQTAHKDNYSLQEATEHLLRYGALLRIHVLDTFGALVYDYYDDFSIGQTEALYTVYEDTFQRKYNIFDIVPSILENQDTRPTTICQYIHKYVSTCLRESSYLCGTIKNHNRANPEASAIKMANITRHVWHRGGIVDHYSLGFSLPDVLEHLKAGRLNVTTGLFAGLLQNVQYDTFDNEVLRAERNVVAALGEQQSRSVEAQRGVEVSEEEIRKAQDISELVKKTLNRNKIVYDESTSRDFALLAEHVVREVEAISRKIEVLGIVYDNGSIDVAYLFDLILPPDVVDSDVTAAKDYLLREMKEHEILEKYLKIDKYAQSGPDDLLIEILEQLKDINFANDLTTALRAHARFWHRSRMIKDLDELLELFDTYENLRRVPRYKDMMSALDEARSELRNSKNVSVEILCNNPRACLRLGLEIVAKCAYVLPKTREVVGKFFQYLSRDGSVRVDNCGPALETCYCRAEPDSMSRTRVLDSELSHDSASEVTEKPQTTLTTSSDDLGTRRTISREPTTRSFRGNEQIDEILTRDSVTLLLPKGPEEVFQEESEGATLSSVENDAGKSNIDTKSKGRDRKKPVLTTTTESSTEETEFSEESDQAVTGTLKSRKLSLTSSQEEVTTMRSEDLTSTTNESTTEDRATSEQTNLAGGEQGSTVTTEESTTLSSRSDSSSTTEDSTTEEPEITGTVALLRSGTSTIEKLPTNDQIAALDMNLSRSGNDSSNGTEELTTEEGDTTEKLYPFNRAQELANTTIEPTTVLQTTTDEENLPGSDFTEEPATTTEQPSSTDGNDSPTSTGTTTVGQTSSGSGNDSTSTIEESTTEQQLTTENAALRNDAEGSTSSSMTESTTETPATTPQIDLTQDATDSESTTVQAVLEVEVTTDKVNLRTDGKLLKSRIEFEVPGGHEATTGLLGRLRGDILLTRKSTPLTAKEQTTERMPLGESNTKMATRDASNGNSTKCAGADCSSDNRTLDFSACSDQLCTSSSVECKDVGVNCSDDSAEESAIACAGKNCTLVDSANSSNLRSPNDANATACVAENCDEAGKTSEAVVPCNIKDPHHRRKLHRLQKVRVISSLHSAGRSHDHAGGDPLSRIQSFDKHYTEANAAVSTSHKAVASNNKAAHSKTENLKAENYLGVQDGSAMATSSVEEVERPIDIPLIPGPSGFMRRVEHEHRADTGSSVDWDVVPAKWIYVANRNGMERSPTEKVAKDVYHRIMSMDKSSALPRVRTTAAWRNPGQKSGAANLPHPKNGTDHPVPKKTIVYENYDEYFPHGRGDRSIIRAPRRMGRRFRGL